MKWSSEVVVAINNIIGGIRVKMQDVRCVSISHVKRKGNHPAHLLDQYAKNIYGYVT